MRIPTIFLIFIIEPTENGSEIENVGSDENDKTRRRSYSLNKKLEIANEYVKNKKGCGFQSIAKKHNIRVSTLQNWVAKKSEIEETITTQMLRSGNVGAYVVEEPNQNLKQWKNNW